MNISRPLHDFLVVERFELSKVSKGGIVLPGQALETNTALGRVLSVGTGKVNEKTGEIIEVDVNVGDVVIFHVTAGTKVSEDKDPTERFLLREENVLAILP